MQLRTESRQEYQEDAYGHSAQKIRDDYIKLVTTGGDGYAVYVPSTNPTKAQHWILRPEKRNVCEPTCA